jgi:hypothetical protein
MEYRGEKITEETGQTDGVLFISPFQCDCYAATDTFVRDLTSNLPAMKSPQTTAEAATIVVPIPHALGRTTSSRGMKVTSIELYYKLDVAGTAFTCKLYKTTLAADGTIPTAAEVTATGDLSGSDAYDADEHKYTLTPSTAAFIADNEAYHVELSITKAATTDLWFYGALVNFTRAL